jgi:hypothetical protein
MTMTKAKLNREGWLTELAEALRPTFKAWGYTIPKYRISCSFPSRRALSVNKRVLGQCFASAVSTGDIHELFVSPVEDDPIVVAGIVVHELGHAAVGTEHAHKAPFRAFMKASGLAGKPTATVVEKGSDLYRLLSVLTKPLGPYPHQRLNASSLPKPQGTRLLKVECPKCGYVCRVTRTWLDVGVPTCPCGKQMEEV